MRVNFNLRAVPAILTLLGLCLAPAAQAATNTGNMTVSATIEAACSVSATTMGFGTVVPGVLSETTAEVTANCTSGTSYTVDLGNGLNHITTGGTGAQYRRQMASGTNRLPYVVYIDATRLTAIDATAVALNNLLTTTTGTGAAAAPVTIYGRVVAGESVAKVPGAYADTVIVTIGF